MPDVQITASGNSYTADNKLIIHDSHGTQMSMYRFFQLALEPPAGGSTWCGNPPYYYGGYSGHLGYDFPATQGTTIRSTCYGTVWRTSHEVSSETMGYYVCVKEDKPDSTYRIHVYMHMVQQPEVHADDIVNQGTLLGYVGNTGDSRGNHVHYGCMSDTSFDNWIDAWSQFDNSTQPTGWTPQIISDHLSNDICSWEWIQDTSGTDYGPGGGGGGGSIKALNIKLRINPPPEIIFNLRYPLTSNTDSLENKRPVNPGYFKPSELYEARNAHLYTESYQMKDTTRTDIIISWDYSLQLSKKPVLLFTTDGRDPLIHGRTTYLKQEGDFEVNDYERSTNIFPILSDYALPINIRAVLIDADDHSLILTRASAVFTRESTAYVQESYSRLRRYHQALLADAPATGKNMYSEDLHGYIELNENYESEKYYDLIPGLEDGDE